jgi:hypothetical protein
MNKNLLKSFTVAALCIAPSLVFAQAPNMGTAVNFVLFSTNGAVSNSGVSQYTGNIGTNNGSSTNFGNVNGTMHDMDAASAKCAADLLSGYNTLAGTTATLFPASNVLGNGQILTPGVYSISGAATLNLGLTLDGQNAANPVFIIRILGSFSTNASSKVYLKNGAQACNVYWQIEGLVTMAAGTTMRGTVIANNAAISLAAGDTLEGRALTTKGAVTSNGVLAYTPVGCGSPLLSGPNAPTLGAAACYAVFSTTGAVTNSGTTLITGDVGSNSSAPTGFNAANITGTLHSTPDGSTAQCAKDLDTAYQQINKLVPDIMLLYPAQFGNNLVLTPHTYHMNGAATLTDTVIMNAQGNANAVFVIQINGALSTTAHSKVKLINGTQAKNVYWKIEGAVTLSDYSVFNGTIICNNGALGAIKTGVVLNGRALTTAGALSITASTITASAIPGNCASVGIQQPASENKSIRIFPNPFSGSVTLVVNNIAELKQVDLKIHTVLGQEVLNTRLINQTTVLETSAMPSGIYFYSIIADNQVIQTGRLVSQQH